MSREGAERRRYPRILADIVWREAGVALFHHQRSVRDVSLGGMRTLTDEAMRVGRRLEIEIMPAGQPPIRAWGRVAWCEPVPQGTGAAYEAGIEFVDLDPADLQRLAAFAQRPG